MSEITTLGWLIAGAGMMILTGLVAYALSLSRQLDAQQRRSAEREASYRALAAQRDSETRDSIAVVCQALVSGDMVATEAALRVNYLITQSQLSDTEQGGLRPFVQLAERTAHLPIRDAWQALDKATKRKLTREREACEAELGDALGHAASSWLATHKPRGVIH